MEREGRLVTIGIWTGIAYEIDGAWYVNPQSILEHMGFDWVAHRKRVVVRFADDILLIQRPSGAGKWKPLMMRLDAAVRWMAGFAGNNHLAPERRAVAEQMAAAVANQFASMVLEKAVPAGSTNIVLLGGGGHDHA
ncbi:MAG: hypothetical protein MUE77_10080 [Sandarakinorhabdus sp.]|jgi:hypothetical protein|nr:hypothetical protein [Sandarakinorhabdus sp.]